MATDKTSPEAIERQRQRARALELREKRMTYRDIADELGVTAATAHRYVTAALTEIIREPAEAVLDLERAELDTLSNKLRDSLTTVAHDPELLVKVVKSILDVQRRRSRLYGFDTKAILDLQRDTGSLPDALQYLALMRGENATPATLPDTGEDADDA